MVGQKTSRSLRLWGQVANQRVRVLIDTRPSHNFICPRLPQEADLAVWPTFDFLVKVGNGEHITNTRRCHQVRVEFPQSGHTPEFLPISFGRIRSSVGLGVVGYLGGCNCEFQRIQAHCGSQVARVVLQGDPELVLWGSGSPICYEGLTGVGAGISGPIMACSATRCREQQHAKGDFSGFGS